MIKLRYEDKIILWFGLGGIFLLHPIFYLIIIDSLPSALQLYIDILVGYIFITLGIFTYLEKRRKKVE